MGFEESGTCGSCTRHGQTARVPLVDLKMELVVMDTVGWLDNGVLSDEDVLRSIASTVSNAASVQPGEGRCVHQIFFACKSRLDWEEVRMWRLINQLIFRGQASPFTTIVRTHFEDYSHDECMEDLARLREAYDALELRQPNQASQRGRLRIDQEHLLWVDARRPK